MSDAEAEREGATSDDRADESLLAVRGLDAGYGVAHKYHSAETHPFKCGRKRVRLTTLLPLPVAG